MTEELARLRRFIEDRIAPDLNSGCWLWMLNAHQKGYGNIGVRKGGKLRNTLAHRAAWRVYRGDIPSGMAVCHKCDTPACVNPAHLFLGTQRQNLHDMYAKGRHARNGQKLTDDDVREIRSDNRSCPTIAKERGISHGTVWLVKRRRTYARVAEVAPASD